MKLKAFFYCGLGLFLSSCVQVPERRDPFGRPASSNAVYKNLAVGLVYSENTPAAIDYVNRKCGVDAANRILAGVAPIIQKTFGSVTKFEKIEAAQSARMDLVVLLDMHANLSSGVWESYKIETDLIVIASDNREIDVIRSSGSSIGYVICGGALRSVESAMNAKLEKNLVSSAKLAEFAKTHVPARRVEESLSPTPRPAASSLPVLRPNYSGAAAVDDYAVIVGIENYADLPAATFAERDADAAASFIRAMGIPDRNVAMLTGIRATRTGLEKTIEAWLPNNVSKKSRVFFFYSGHGAPDTKTNDAYLVPSDGDPQYLAQTGYPLKRLYSKLGALEAKSVIVMLDSCFSGAGGRSVLAKGTRPLVGKVDMAIESEGRISVISASAGDQISGSNDDVGYGLFTYSFLQGLNGAAKDAQGRVTLKSLYDYLKPQVEDAARRMNREQVPQLQSSEAELVLRHK